MSEPGGPPAPAAPPARAARPTRAPLSVLVPTLDEEVNLPECLASVAWADEVVVVDSYSTDRTVAIAQSLGATVVQHPFENYSKQKNWALDSLPLRHDWVLILDADERVTPELRAEIERVVAEEPPVHGPEPPAAADPSSAAGHAVPPAGPEPPVARPEAPAGPAPPPGAPVAYYLNRRFIFLGRWIRRAGWYPSWHIRLLRRGFGRYDNREVHEHMVVRGPVGYLGQDLLHLDRRGLEAFVARHNRYSTLEAAARFKAERGAADRAELPAHLFGSQAERKRYLRERIWPRVPAKPLVLFLYLYLVRRGFMDGRAGLALCVFHAFQEFMVGLKLAELRRESRPATADGRAEPSPPARRTGSEEGRPAPDS